MTAETLWNDYLKRATEEHDRKRGGESVVSRDVLPAESTELGTLRWYMHPDHDDVVDHSLYFFELEIPPMSRSGKLYHQGGIVHLVVEGRGYTLVDDERHEWEEFDVIAVPPRPDGVTIQHFNTSAVAVRLAVTFPNFDSPLGPGLGVEPRVVEPAPEYR